MSRKYKIRDQEESSRLLSGHDDEAILGLQRAHPVVRGLPRLQLLAAQVSNLAMTMLPWQQKYHPIELAPMK